MPPLRKRDKIPLSCRYCHQAFKKPGWLARHESNHQKKGGKPAKERRSHGGKSDPNKRYWVTLGHAEVGRKGVGSSRRADFVDLCTPSPPPSNLPTPPQSPPKVTTRDGLPRWRTDNQESTPGPSSGRKAPPTELMETWFNQRPPPRILSAPPPGKLTDFPGDDDSGSSGGESGSADSHHISRALSPPRFMRQPAPNIRKRRAPSANFRGLPQVGTHIHFDSDDERERLDGLRRPSVDSDNESDRVQDLPHVVKREASMSPPPTRAPRRQHSSDSLRFMTPPSTSVEPAFEQESESESVIDLDAISLPSQLGSRTPSPQPQPETQTELQPGQTSSEEEKEEEDMDDEDEPPIKRHKGKRARVSSESDVDAPNLHPSRSRSRSRRKARKQSSASSDERRGTQTAGAPADQRAPPSPKHGGTMLQEHLVLTNDPGRETEISDQLALALDTSSPKDGQIDFSPAALSHSLQHLVKSPSLEDFLNHAKGLPSSSRLPATNAGPSTPLHQRPQSSSASLPRPLGKTVDTEPTRGFARRSKPFPPGAKPLLPVHSPTNPVNPTDPQPMQDDDHAPRAPTPRLTRTPPQIIITAPTPRSSFSEQKSQYKNAGAQTEPQPVQDKKSQPGSQVVVGTHHSDGGCKTCSCAVQHLLQNLLHWAHGAEWFSGCECKN